MRFLPQDAADELLVTPPCLAGGAGTRAGSPWPSTRPADGATTTLRSPRSSIWSGPTSRPS